MVLPAHRMAGPPSGRRALTAARDAWLEPPIPMTTKASASARTRAACSSRKSTRSGPAASSTLCQPRLSRYRSSPAAASASRGAAARTCSSSAPGASTGRASVKDRVMPSMLSPPWRSGPPCPQGSRLHQRGLAVAAELHNQGAHGLLHATAHGVGNESHGPLVAGAVHDGVHDGGQEGPGVKGVPLLVQQLPDAAHLGVLLQLRVVAEQLAEVAGDGQADVGVHVDLADAAGDGRLQLLLGDAVGVLDVPPQGVDLIDDIPGHGGGARGTPGRPECPRDSCTP